MPIANINGNLLVKTTAQWAVDATVYSSKKILITSDAFYTGTDQHKFKLGDGVQTWSNLDYFDPYVYAAAQAAAAQAAAEAYADGKVADAIADGVTTIAPSQNAVFDALALKTKGIDFYVLGNNAIADSTTYYIGQISATIVTSTNSTGGVCLPAGTIKGAIISVYSAGTIASPENITMSLLHGTSYGTESTITTTLTLDANRQACFPVTGLSIVVAADCVGLLKLVVPPLSTNPNAIQIRVLLIY